MRNVPRYITGLAAAALSLLFIMKGAGEPPVLFASVFLLLICISDTLYTKIPNLLTCSVAVVGFIFNFSQSGLPGLAFSVLGLALGLGLFLWPFLAGGMGAGDVKALAGLGALLGPGAIFQVFLYTAFVGGVMAIVQYLFSRQLLSKIASWWAALLTFAGTRKVGDLLPVSVQEKLKFPYATAIAFGYYAFIVWGDIFPLAEKLMR
jgi:prepilin peptidase CpaA